MSRTTVRLLFLAVLPLLFVQFLIAKLYEEPYPAIMFPGFGQVIPVDSLYPYHYERLRIYAHTATDTVRMTLPELFAPFPSTYPEDALFAPIRTTLKSIPEQLTPTAHNSQERELVRYLSRQVRQQLGPDVQQLTLTYYQYRADANGQVSQIGITDQKTLHF